MTRKDHLIDSDDLVRSIIIGRHGEGRVRVREALDTRGPRIFGVPAHL